MSSKQQKFHTRRNLEEIKGTLKQKNLISKIDKENIIDYFKKEKSRSNQKNQTIATQNSFKIPFMKKSNNKTSDGQQNFESKKLKTQADLIINKKQTQGFIRKDKQDFNLTMFSKKSQEKSQLKKNGENSYFLTADVSNVLKAIHNNCKLQSSLVQKNDKKPNMMTQEDIERLFERDEDDKKQTQERQIDQGKFSQKEKKINLIDQIKLIQQRLKFQQDFSKSKKKPNNLLTDPNQRKVETMKLNIRQILGQDQENNFTLNKARKDFAQSIKFLEISEQPYDKLLSALIDQNLVKVQTDPNIDKTAKFKEQFVVGKQIGEGAYASVRVAIYKPQNKKVAIKIYQKKKIKQIQRRKSVRRQIKILQKIDHKNILKIYDVIQTNNHVNIIMEYIPGISLNTYLKSQAGSKISQKDARKIFVPLIQALKYLHQINICHRDIKLENILLDSKLFPKLIDFGFSTCIQNEKKVKMFCGTPSYMAPEIVQKKQYKGTLADIWAIGVLLYVMFTGIFPFKGNTDKELYTKISNADYAKLQFISKTGQNLIQRMLTIDPDQRINASQILEHPWVTGKQSKLQTLKESKDFTRKNINSSNNEIQEKIQRLMKVNKIKQEKLNQMNELKYDQSKQKIGLAETYKQKNLRYELRMAKDQSNNFSSPNHSKPRTCTNREANKIKFEDQDKYQKKQQQKSKQYSNANKQNKYLQNNKRKQKKSNQKHQQNNRVVLEQKLTNKRYF